MRGSVRAATLVALVGLIAVGVAGCSGDATASTSPTTESPASPSAVNSATPTPTPAPEVATKEQFASIIAGEEAEWREVIDQASDCRFLWVMGPDGPADEANAMTCYLREVTIVMSTGTAAKEIRALEAPSDLEGLVDGTLVVLDAISDIDLEGACGEPFDGPEDSEECRETLGSLIWEYDGLEKVLDKWKPYV